MLQRYEIAMDTRPEVAPRHEWSRTTSLLSNLGITTESGSFYYGINDRRLRNSHFTIPEYLFDYPGVNLRS